MTPPNRSQERQAQLLLLLVVFIWATNYPIAKFAISKLDVFLFNGIRFVVASGVLAVMFFSRSPWIPANKADWRKILRAGIIANVFYQSAFIIGLSLTTAGNSAVLMATSPLWTLFVNAKLHKEKIQPNMWLGMAISLAGVLMIIAEVAESSNLAGMKS